MTLVNYVQNCI